MLSTRPVQGGERGLSAEGSGGSPGFVGRPHIGGSRPHGARPLWGRVSAGTGAPARAALGRVPSPCGKAPVCRRDQRPASGRARRGPVRAPRVSRRFCHALRCGHRAAVDTARAAPPPAPAVSALPFVGEDVWAGRHLQSSTPRVSPVRWSTPRIQGRAAQDTSHCKGAKSPKVRASPRGERSQPSATGGSGRTHGRPWAPRKHAGGPRVSNPVVHLSKPERGQAAPHTRTERQGDGEATREGTQRLRLRRGASGPQTCRRTERARLGEARPAFRGPRGLPKGRACPVHPSADTARGHCLPHAAPFSQDSALPRALPARPPAVPVRPFPPPGPQPCRVTVSAAEPRGPFGHLGPLAAGPRRRLWTRAR